MNIDAEALSEVDVIIGMMPREESIKIPNAFKNFIKTRKSQNYIPNIKNNIPLHQQELKKDTKTICSLIYRSYLCSKEEKIRLAEQDKEILIQQEQELREKYNPDNLFRNRQKDIETPSVEEHTELVEYKEPKWYQKLFMKILKIFKK